LFYGTSIAVNILVLSKHKADNKIQFIDASTSDFYKKDANNNILTEKHIEGIMDAFDSKDDIPYFATSIDFDKIAANNHNLSVSSYVESKDTREEIDITELNTEIKNIAVEINQLRANIDSIIEELEEKL
jgi:type I restriction enzyme M protein